ncbi:BspA family leucine-rich repeat surface protein [Candidatus Saccharibacteria bacterium]|nr:BspA family leucine-rich repeat surface protein [Candidatus Saccharibacteria bacterium]
MKQTQNTGNFACKFSVSSGFARLKNFISTKRARTITAMFAFFVSLLSLCFLQNPSFASILRTPATYLNISTSTPNVDFQFNQSELSSSAFKTNNVTVNIQTDNATGATTYISSIDEATSLVHSDSGVSDSIASISSPLLSTAFSGKTWGYRVGSLATTAFNPIPKASTPAEILNTTSATPASNSLNIDFGVKVSPDLSSGTYSKQILFTTITNYVQLRTTFLPGPAFNPIVLNLDTMHLTTGSFEHSATPPANLSDATIVSTADSEKPIYAWFDSTSQKVLWWTEADVAYANEDCSYMFNTDNMGHSIGNIDLRGINTSRVKSMKYMFNGGKEGLTGLNLSEMDTSNVEDMSYMFYYMFAHGSHNAVALDLSRFNTSKVKNMEGMFFHSVVTPLDLRSFDTSNVENMSNMFSGLDTTALDISPLNTSKVKTMKGMFSGHRKDNQINLSTMDTSNVEDMSEMFAGGVLTSVDLSGLNTSKVTNMSSMFKESLKLTNVNFGHIDTSHVTDMSHMFDMVEPSYSYITNNPDLTNLDVSALNTSNVVNMSDMFAGLKKVTNLDLSTFDTSNVENMSWMFYRTFKLKHLNLQSFDTRKVKNMDYMFAYSSTDPAGDALDISSFDTRSLTDALQMFYYIGVRTIYVSNTFTTDLISDQQDMFSSSPNLIGGNGTVFSASNPRDKTYARIDAPGAPGYFTQKP